MATLSPTELNFLRLLERTKRLTRENMAANVWKVCAATTFLENLISRMQDEQGAHSKEVLLQYRREVSQLKILADAEKKASAEEKLMEVEKIPRLFPDVQVKIKVTTSENVSEIKASIDDEKGVESSAGVRERNKTLYRADLRRQLLGTVKSGNQGGENEDDAFRKHEALEAELANELLSMTRSLKTTMHAASAVINDDNKRLTKMQAKVDSNKSSLETEGERLAHHAYKCGFDCMRVLLVVLVFWSFIAMVILMKVFPKRVSS